MDFIAGSWADPKAPDGVIEDRSPADLSLLLGRRLEGTGGRSRGRVYDIEVVEGESGPEATALLVGWPGLLARLGLKRSVADRARISWDQAAHLPRSGSW